MKKLFFVCLFIFQVEARQQDTFLVSAMTQLVEKFHEKYSQNFDFVIFQPKSGKTLKVLNDVVKLTGFPTKIKSFSIESSSISMSHSSILFFD
jgi:hypothetical protein